MVVILCQHAEKRYPAPEVGAVEFPYLQEIGIAKAERSAAVREHPAPVMFLFRAVKACKEDHIIVHEKSKDFIAHNRKVRVDGEMKRLPSDGKVFPRKSLEKIGGLLYEAEIEERFASIPGQPRGNYFQEQLFLFVRQPREERCVFLKIIADSHEGVLFAHPVAGMVPKIVRDCSFAVGTAEITVLGHLEAEFPQQDIAVVILQQVTDLLFTAGRNAFRRSFNENAPAPQASELAAQVSDCSGIQAGSTDCGDHLFLGARKKISQHIKFIIRDNESKMRFPVIENIFFAIAEDPDHGVLAAENRDGRLFFH